MGLLNLVNGKKKQILDTQILENPESSIHGNFAISRNYTSPSTSGVLTTASLLALELYAMPFIVAKKKIFSSTSIFVTTASGSLIRTGIYSDLNCYPVNRIADFGSVSGTPTGLKTYTANLPIELKKGLYWLVITGSLACTIKGFAITSLLSVLGFDLALNNQSGLGYSINNPSGLLPGTFPVSANIRTTVPLPAIFLRSS
jgi:hypothetical protein